MEEKDMKPVVVSASGKVEGIKGLFKDERTGRFFVRKTIKTPDGKLLDRQKTVHVNANLTFSGLEILAQRALKALEKEMRPIVDAMPTPAPKAQKTPLEQGQIQLKRFLEGEKGKYSSKTLGEKMKRCDGFALVTRSLLNDEATITEHNKNLLIERLAKYEGRNEASEIFKDLSSVFNSALKAGVHVGVNPTALVKKPCDVLKKDFKYITINQMGEIINLINLEFDYNLTKVTKNYTREELLLYFYLLCIGMRATSAILFKIEELKKLDGNYIYNVINNKIGKVMPYYQIISEKIYNNFNLFFIGNFDHSDIELSRELNKYIKVVCGEEYSSKHLRKGFINSCCSGGFEPQFVEMITHEPSGVFFKNYYSIGQTKVNEIMNWFNNELEKSIRFE